MIIKRYRPIACNAVPSGTMMIADKDGDYVRYDEAKRLVDDAMQTSVITAQLLERAVAVPDIG